MSLVASAELIDNACTITQSASMTLPALCNCIIEAPSFISFPMMTIAPPGVSIKPNNSFSDCSKSVLYFALFLKGMSDHSSIHTLSIDFRLKVHCSLDSHLLCCQLKSRDKAAKPNTNAPPHLVTTLGDGSIALSQRVAHGNPAHKEETISDSISPCQKYGTQLP